MVEVNGVRRHKGRRRSDELDIVAHQLMTGDIDLVLDHPVGAKQQILHRDVLLHGVGSAVEFARAVAAELECGLAQGLRRDRAEIDTAATKHGLALDDGDFLVELGALDRRPLAGRPGADHQQIVVERVSRHTPPHARRVPIDNAISL